MTPSQTHEHFVRYRRSTILAQRLSPLFPQGKAKILDVGCGDGTVAQELLRLKPELDIVGIDTLVRPSTAIPVTPFDGKTIPFPANHFDYCLIVDVLHHTEDPFKLLKEATRVSSQGLIIKDHKAEGVFAYKTLALMDNVANRRHGVSLPHLYWKEREWFAAFERLGLEKKDYLSTLHLYPLWADWLFGRGLHFITRLEKKNPAEPPPTIPT
jgi:SAM-dependent methyltransferase